MPKISHLNVKAVSPGGLISWARQARRGEFALYFTGHLGAAATRGDSHAIRVRDEALWLYENGKVHLFQVRPSPQDPCYYLAQKR